MSRRRKRPSRDIAKTVGYGHNLIRSNRFREGNLWRAVFEGGVQVSFCATVAVMELNRVLSRAGVARAAVTPDDYRALLRKVGPNGAVRCRVADYTGPEVAAKLLIGLRPCFDQGEPPPAIKRMIAFVAASVRPDGTIETLQSRCGGGERVYPAAVIAIALSQWAPQEHRDKIGDIVDFLERQWDVNTGLWRHAERRGFELAVSAVAFIAVRRAESTSVDLRKAAEAIANGVIERTHSQFFDDKCAKPDTDAYQLLRLNRYAWSADALIEAEGVLPDRLRRNAMAALTEVLLEKHHVMLVPGRRIPNQDSIEEFAKDMTALHRLGMEQEGASSRRFRFRAFGARLRRGPERRSQARAVAASPAGDDEGQMLRWTKLSALVGLVGIIVGAVISLFT
ncbi:hypothetical protein [Glycomyces harbinensis]|uniref:Uncharacterized protein n=1 Tax=Glycomyces harbinensis TaxID=58114 RepID=A0A1G6WKX0_9ACTN|nr:hypothetical protein [Glycomyces harbinensis]SDD66600.1 hypothetical protein SAMN05216270_106100 [Glycomyces harbinensis]